ncbi:MAG TPA: hypothetical protein DCO77_07790 [Nitrospiraceae bacterium]|nr:hypothetical protein [Nitrospiraceae bacterium]
MVKREDILPRIRTNEREFRNDVKKKKGAVDQKEKIVPCQSSWLHVPKGFCFFVKQLYLFAA